MKKNKNNKKEKLLIFSIVFILAIAFVVTLQSSGKINLFASSVNVDDYIDTEYFPHKINQVQPLSIIGIDFLNDINTCNYEEGTIQKVFSFSGQSEAPFLYYTGGQYTLNPEYYGSEGNTYLYTWYGKSDSCGSEDYNHLTNPQIIIQGVANVGGTIDLPSTDLKCTYFRVDLLSCQIKPECFDEMTTCEGASSFICSASETWTNQGAIAGKCGIPFPGGDNGETNETDNGQTGDQTGDQEETQSVLPIIIGIALFVILIIILFSLGGKKRGR